MATTVLKSGKTNKEMQMQSQSMITQLLSLVGKKKESETTITIKKLISRKKIVVALFGGLFNSRWSCGSHSSICRVKLKENKNEVMQQVITFTTILASIDAAVFKSLSKQLSKQYFTYPKA
ncbi:hypothetical protein P4601_16210 [Peribacillus frigoritolerans]|uniref:hypothetical protein n=1 Tax=Peribacillus frigoritolerans TaxID=450367 RepID=UPI002E1FE0A1|nr:hypothetical protein [Peribacillus frigoritolerans]